jgi:hypothetical protein
MESIAQLIGLEVAQLTQLVTLGVVLLVILLVLRIVLKLTATIFKVGCLGILFIVAVVFVLQLLGPF